jgi:5-methylcytosine-specific restriction endonuclease McrA
MTSKLLNCIECGDVFARQFSRQVCCSPECTKKHKRNYDRIFDRTYSKLPSRKAYMQQYLKSYAPQYKKTDKYKEYLKTYKPSEITIVKRKIWKHSDKYKAYQKIYHKSEGYKKSKRKWITSENGRMITRLIVIKRRARLSNIILKFTKQEWINKVKSTKGVCPGFKREAHYIGEDKLTLDHTYPVSEASKDYETTGKKRVYTINDVQPLCQGCNSSKHNKIIPCQ